MSAADGEVPPNMEVPILSLNLIESVRELQQQYGLKSYDYLRYRSYCTRRLRRIHKTLRMFAGTQKKYKGLVINPEDVTEVRVLMLLILTVERAWAYGEQLRQDHSQTDDPRKHRHYASRMTKAAVYADDLQRVVNYVCDARTKREVAAYVEEIKGHRDLAKKNWKNAKQRFTTARGEYAELQKDARGESTRVALGTRMTDLDQSIRLCTYNLGETHAGQGAGDAEGFAGMKLEWRGQAVPVVAEKVRILLTQAQEHAKDAQAIAPTEADAAVLPSLSKYVDAYDKVFIAYNDAIAQVKQDIAQEKMADPASLHLLLNCLKFNLLEHTLARNSTLVQVHAGRVDQADTRAARREGKQTTTFDMVRLLDGVTQTVESMLAIPGVEDDDRMAPPLEAQLLRTTAQKQFYQAETFRTMGEWSHAMMLYNAAVASVGDALAFSRKHKLDDAAVAKAADQIRGARCICKADAAVAQLESGADAAQQKQLDKCYETFVRSDAITGIPPEYRSMPCRPIFLDVAAHMLPPVSIDSRIIPDKKGAKPSITKAAAAKPSLSQPAAKPAAAASDKPADEKKGWGGWGWGWGGDKAN